MLNRRTWALAAAALLVTIVAVSFFAREQPKPAGPTAKTDEHRAVAPRVSAPARNMDDASVSAQPSTAPAVPIDHEDDGRQEAAFRVDAAGELVMDEQTRLNIEALIAQNEPAELQAAVLEQTAHLPPAAARFADELVDRFVYYQQAQRQTYPPDDAPSTEDEALRQLEGLRGLREAHFGADLARQLFAKEEAIGREMIELMRIENDQSLTPEEKLARSQALREQLPGVAAIEKSNRESAAKRD
jgi:hypothetical protein